MSSVDTVSDRAKQRLLAAAILASFVSFLDGSITNIALPAIERDLHGGIVLQQWVVDGYLLTLSAFILLAGAVSDAVGRLRVLRIAIVAFAVTSLLCAVSPTAGVLVGARLLQGVAGALLVPGSLSLIIATFDGEQQSRAIGRWTGWTSTSSLVGPIAGGVLVDGLGWRSVFVLSVLPAVAAMLLLGRTRDEAAAGRGQRIDVPSSVLAALGLAGLTAGLIELGGSRGTGLPAPVAVTLACVGAVLIVAFVLRDRRTPHPLVPGSLFRARNFAWGNGATLLVYAGLGIASLVPTVFLQQVAGLSAALAAIVSLPSTLLMIVLSGRFGALAGRFGPRAFMTAGPLVAAVGFVVMASVRSPSLALWSIVPGLVLFGLGLSITVAPLTSAVLGAVPPAQSGIGSAVNNAVSRVAILLATASVGAIVGGALTVPSFARAMLVAAALLLGGAAVSFAGIRGGTRTT